MTPAVEIEQLSVNYDSVTALLNIDLSVQQNEFLTIIGPNGGGKTTLIRTLLGLQKPIGGKIKVFGEADYLKKGLMGYVPQYAKFDPHFPITVNEVVLTGLLSNNRLKLFHRYSKRERAKAAAVLESLKLGHLGIRHISQLSGGQMQRVLIARALVNDPEILILDEPTASVDPESRQQIYETLVQLKAEKTIILSSHDTGTIETYTDTVACLNQALHYYGEPPVPVEAIKKMYGFRPEQEVQRFVHAK